MATVWHFRREQDGWVWACSTGIGPARRSHKAFPSFVACVADASAHGYEPRVPETPAPALAAGSAASTLVIRLHSASGPGR
jgi:hypothetical protein